MPQNLYEGETQASQQRPATLGVGESRTIPSTDSAGKRPVVESEDSDWKIYVPLAATHDIVGYNYQIHKSYPRDVFINQTRVVDNSYIIGDLYGQEQTTLGGGEERKRNR